MNLYTMNRFKPNVYEKAVQKIPFCKDLCRCCFHKYASLNKQFSANFLKLSNLKTTVMYLSIDINHYLKLDPNIRITLI